MTAVLICIILYLLIQYSWRQKGGAGLEIVVSNKTSRPLYEQITSQIKMQIMSGELKAGEALPSIRSLAKSLQISVLTVQKGLLRQQPEKGVLFRLRILIFIWRNSRKRLRSTWRKRSR